ncbi:ABC transporter ATP-binding protein [Haloimpatiens massiliensis]|uniref:ABC transporter ATP-binding protein n=1 Tax=Haloimpatiens massiliensis TaxID=1658110 RepID=UPI000C82C6FF|nr:ABC transporter ATP-binding protein [Haloimpatiens massiliensis]
MKNSKLLWNFMKGNRLKYIGAILSIGLATFFSTLSPLVIRTTIDSILGGKPMELSEAGVRFVNFLGGKSVLVQNLWICTILLVIITLVRGIFLFLKGRWSASASENIAKNIRETLYNHIQHLPYDYHVKCETGDLIQRCTSDVDTIRRFLAMQLVDIGRAVFILIFSITMMLSLNVKMTLIAMAAVPIIFAYSWIFFNGIKKLFQKADESEAKMTTALQENLSGVRVVRAFGRQKYEVDKFNARSEEFRDLSYKMYALRGNYWSISDFLCMLQTGAVLIAGVYLTARGEMTLGTLFVFTTYEGMLLWPVRQLGRILSDAGKMVVSINRISEVLGEKEEKISLEDLKPEVKGNIEFQQVYFEYEKDVPVLDGVSFKVKKGETVGIMGRTGSGKSSLVHLLARLYDYDRGSIKIDGVELKNINRKWIRKNIGIVLQEPFLFSKSIKDNISLAKKEAVDKDIFEAADIAAVHDVIMGFDRGYETLVGEKGVTLSGGQRQRVAIARTVINKSPILIFDDSLSAVDTETDRAIRKALSKRSKGVTTLIISHRVSTLKEANKIIVLDKGKIVDMGSHEELIKKDGLYKRIWEIQSSSEGEHSSGSKVS